MTTDADRGLEVAMGNMLRIGVTVAALVVLAGGVLYLTQFHGPVQDYRAFHGAPQEDRRVGSIFAAAVKLDSSGLIELGILLLIATPILRVAFGLVGFARMKDWLYSGVSAVVLTILLYSFFARQ